MQDSTVKDKCWSEPQSDSDIVKPRKALPASPLRRAVLRRIRGLVPRAWVPLAVRGLTVAAEHLPGALRYRVDHFLGLMRSDMGDIERDYPAWIERYDCLDARTCRNIKAAVARIAHPPLISVVMPVFDPPPDHLLAAISSLRSQLYPWWELCIGDDASTDPAVTEILRDAAAHDHRIKLVRRAENGHISAASNSALLLATGPFVALLDHDDVLPPHALYEVAAKIIACPDVDIIYSDEDHIDNEGRRSHPYFKPDWNPELMLGQNLISHLGVYRRTLLEQIGGFRIGFEGSQDYDLALRMVAKTRAEHIVHIPKVLYHWRQGAADRTFSQAAHDSCVQSGRRALHEFITWRHRNASVEPAPLVPAWTRVVYPLPEPPPLVSVVIASGGPPGALADCISGLLTRTNYPAVEILISDDDARTPELPEMLARDERLRHIGGHHPSLTAKAAEQARGSLLLLLDPRLVPGGPGWLREMVSYGIRPDVGAVGAKLLCPRGRVLHAGIVVGGRTTAFMPFVGRHRSQAGYFGHLQLARDVTAASGKCLLIDRDAFLAVGGLDEALSETAYSDVDLCLKLAEQGYRTVWTPYAELYLHDEVPQLGTFGPYSRRGAARMRQRWGAKLDADRYWSPNLSCESGDLGLAFPPRRLQANTLTPASAGPKARCDRAKGYGDETIAAAD